MESSSPQVIKKLPLLPSERRKRAIGEMCSTSPDKQSSTEIDNLAIKPSESANSSHLDDEYDGGDTHADESAEIGPLKQDFDLEMMEEEKKHRDDQVKQFQSAEPIPVTSTTDQLLHYINTTQHFMDRLELEISNKLDTLTEKVDRIDRSISMIESKRKEQKEA